MEKYKPTIGLEIHAELNTRTKMFCDCKNDPDERRPNVNICPVCMGHPGTLPVPNKEAIKHILKVGLSLGGEVNELSEFDRKNYFYPDIPKGYQISQYKYPLILGGELSGVQVTRIHLEEDTAKSTHNAEGHSLVDFNRAGVPLMELVTEPVIHSAEAAVRFSKELQLLLQYLGVAEANMEKGEIRFEANISVSPEGSDKLGTKVEVKNLNSFRALEKAIEVEVGRQSQLLIAGEAVVQETRGWDDTKETTFSQRSKENSHDYRYFPDPDIPKLRVWEVEGWSEEALRKELSETPNEKRSRFASAYGLPESQIEFYINNQKLSGLFEKSVSLISDNKENFKTLSNYITNDVAGAGKTNINPSDLAALVELITLNKISSRGAKDIIGYLIKGETGPEAIAEKYGLMQKSDEGELLGIVGEVIAANPTVVAEYKSGKISSIQFLVGQSMKLSKGAGNPSKIREILEKELAK